MKKLLILLTAMLLAIVPALAEMNGEVAVPVEILPPAADMLQMADAIAAAKATLEVLPADCLTRAEFVRMSDGSRQWIVTIFDLGNFANGWCISVDAGSGVVLTTDVTNTGYFDTVSERWVSVKGVEPLWSLEDKLLFDTLFTMQPTYGLPMSGDMSQAEALAKAMAAVGLETASGYDVGYGYIMGAGETNGVWEVWFLQGGETIYKVNLDAVNGEIYLIEPEEDGNG